MRYRYPTATLHQPGNVQSVLTPIAQESRKRFALGRHGARSVHDSFPLGRDSTAPSAREGAISGWI